MKLTDLQQHFGAGLTAVYRYQRWQDVFWVVILDSIDLTTLPSKKITPNVIFFTPADIHDGADVFPLELGFIRTRSELLHGSDILAAPDLDSAAIRSQLEYELRSKTIIWRHLALNSKSKQTIIQTAWEQIVLFIGGVLLLKHQPIGSDWELNLTQVEKIFDQTFPAFRAALDIESKRKISKNEELAIMQAMHQDMTQLTAFINHLTL